LSALAVGILLGLAAAAVFEVSYLLLTIEARSVSVAPRPNASFLARLVHRRRWVEAMALNGLAFALEIAALERASLLVIQPLLAVGLVLLVLLARAYLHEPVGGRQIAGAVLVAAGVTVVIVGAPSGTSRLHFDAASALVVLVLVAILGFPQLTDRGSDWRLVAAAAAGDTLVALGSNAVAAAWPDDVPVVIVSVAAVAIFGLTSTTSESAALQRLPAFRVGPIVSAAQITLPVLLVALLAHNRFSSAPLGGLLLAGGVAIVGIGAWLLSRHHTLPGERPRLQR